MSAAANASGSTSPEAISGATACPRTEHPEAATFWSGFLRLPARMLIGLIRVYQVTLSPALPILTLGRCGCRFSPTCSHYAADAIRVHGVGRGVGLAVVRLLKCTPLHPGGLDPVPPRRPVCERQNSGRARSPSGPNPTLQISSGPPGGRALPLL